MERTSQISDRTVILTVILWMTIFLVFSSAALALAVTSHKMFAFLIIVGLVTSTLAADLYVTKHRNTSVSYNSLCEQELSIAQTPFTSQHLFPSSSSFKSEPCLCTERVVLPPRYYSSPRLSTSSMSVLVGAVAPQDSPKPQKPNDPVQDTEKAMQKKTATVAEGNRVSFGEKHRSSMLCPSNSNETSFTCSLEMPSFWKDEISLSSVDSIGETEGAMPPSPQFSESSKGVTSVGSDSRYLHEAFLEGPSDGSTVQGSTSLLQAMDVPVGITSNEIMLRLQELEDIWKTCLEGRTELGALHARKQPTSSKRMKPPGKTDICGPSSGVERKMPEIPPDRRDPEEGHSFVANSLSTGASRNSPERKKYCSIF